jgi:hypothetical protein
VAHCTCQRGKGHKQPCKSDQPIVSLWHDILSETSSIRTPGFAKRGNHRALLTILDNVMDYRSSDGSMGCAISTVLALLAPAGPKITLSDMARQMETAHHSQYLTRSDT